MDPFSDNFINYDELPVGYTEKFELQQHLPSPNSDSTGPYTNSVSPPYPIQQDHLAFDVSDHEVMSSQNLYHPYTNQEIGNEVYGEQEYGISDKSKRIQKRNAAKERTLSKKVATSNFSEIDPSLLPEGFDDPNLDERTKKKMIQMVRNRVSAQNSRDRKKNHLNNLEQKNQELEELISILMNEKQSLLDEVNGLKYDNSRLYQENQSFRQNNKCSSCGGSNGDDFGLKKDEIYIQDSNEEGIPIGGFSGLSSPRLARFSSAGKGFLGFFAVVAFVSVVAVVNVQQENPSIEGSFSSQRVLEDDNQMAEFTEDYDIDISTNYHAPSRSVLMKNNDVSSNYPEPGSSIIMKNIVAIKNEFEMNYEPTFDAHFQDLGYVQNNYAYIPNPQVNNIYPNSIIQYDAFKETNFRRRAPTIISQTLPVVSERTSSISSTATLFCPSVIEFFTEKNQPTNLDVGYSSNSKELDVLNADYLQLLVPKNTITRHDTKKAITDVYGIPIGSGNKSDEGLLEIWVKVFYMREITSSYT